MDDLYATLQRSRDEFLEVKSPPRHPRNIKEEYDYSHVGSQPRHPRELGEEYKYSDVDFQPMQELYLTNDPVDHRFSLRAEEIAACLAMSAKHSLEESQLEKSHLRSKVVLLEEEKEAELASLRAKIRFLKNELVHAETPREFPSSRRRRRYVIDPFD